MTSLEESQYIVDMTRHTGWKIVEGEIKARITALNNSLITAEFNSSEDSFKIKGMIHEIKALKGLLNFVANRHKAIEKGGN